MTAHICCFFKNKREAQGVQVEEIAENSDLWVNGVPNGHHGKPQDAPSFGM